MAACLGAPVTVTAQAWLTEAIQRVELWRQGAFDVVYGVDQPRVQLHLPAPEDAHTARLADATLVIAVDIGAHGQLGLVLGRVQQGADLPRIRQCVRAAGNGAGDRAGLDAPPLHPHVHLGRCGQQILPVAQIHQRTIGRRVVALQAGEDLRRAVPTYFVEHLARDDFEQIAAPERLHGSTHDVGIFAGAVITRGRNLTRLRSGGGHERRALPAAPQPAGSLPHPRSTGCQERPAHKVIAVQIRDAGLMIDNQHFVRQVEHQFPRCRVAGKTLAHRLKLEAQLIAEGAVEPQVRILGAFEMRAECAQHRKHAGLAGTGFLRKLRRGRPHLHKQGIAVTALVRKVRMPVQSPLQLRQQHSPTGIQCLDAHGTATGGDDHRRIHETDVPAGVAPGVLEPGAEQHTAFGVQALTQTCDGIRLADGEY